MKNIKKSSIKILSYLLAIFLISLIIIFTSQNLTILSKTANFFSDIIYLPVNLINNILFAQNQIKQLKKENIDLKAQVAKLLEKAAENDFLYKSLALKNFKNRLIKTRILFYPIDNKNQAYISLGTNDGITNGLALVVNESILVGKIISVSPLKSKVAFSIDPEFSSPATIPGLNINAVAKGNGKTISVIVNINDEAKKITIGSPVLSGNFDPLIPPRLLLGKVSNITEDKKINILNLEVTPALNIDQISDVFIINGVQPQ